MTELPVLLRRAPKIFYILSFLVAAAYFGLIYWDLASSEGFDRRDPGVQKLMITTLFNALQEAIYLIGTGALIDIAIRIWDKIDRKEAAQ